MNQSNHLLQFIDTHAHLNSHVFNDNRHQLIKELVKAGFKILIVPGYDLKTSKLALELAHQYDFIYASIGFHPTDVGNLTEDDYRWLEEQATDPKVVAIGECGYDFHWKTTTYQQQKQAFIRQIEIAKTVNKPLIIHCRDALQATYDTLVSSQASIVGGIMHSYSGSAEMANSFIKLGFWLGLGGPLTFVNAIEPKKVAQAVDLTYLVIETDCPYLTPHPHRGKTNTPLYLPLIVEQLAKIKEITIEQVLEVTNQNVHKIFKI